MYKKKSLNTKEGHSLRIGILTGKDTQALFFLDPGSSASNSPRVETGGLHQETVNAQKCEPQKSKELT